MKASVQVINADKAKRSVSELGKRLAGNDKVLVGVQKGAGDSDEGTPLAVIAAANHFGATINHPGGTAYGYKTKRDAENGKLKFLKSGEGFMELGKTGPHTINIPARRFLDIAVQNNDKKYSKIAANLIPQVLEGKMDMDEVLDKIGNTAAADVQSYMRKLREPPNAPSTVRQKKSNNPLIDKGTLRQSIRHEIAREPVEEGL